MKQMIETRRALSEARRKYREDLSWLRREFGIIPDVDPATVKESLLAALEALEKDDLPSLKAAVASVRGIHDQVMRYVVWDLLERTKIGLKSLPPHDPIRKARTRQWNEACWKKHPWITKGDFRSYRDSIRMLASL